MSINNIYMLKAFVWGFLSVLILLSFYFQTDISRVSDFYIKGSIALAETKTTSPEKHAQDVKSGNEKSAGKEQKSSTEKPPQEETKKEIDTIQKAENPQTSAASPGAQEGAPLMQPEDIRAVMETLERKRKSLLEEESRLRKERTNLENLKLDIENKIFELTEIQKKIEDDLNRKAVLTSQQEKKIEDAELQKIKQLVKLYSSMKAKNAAAIIDKMDMNVVYQIFSNMKGEQAGEILSYVNQERAAKISELLVAKDKHK